MADNIKTTIKKRRPATKKQKQLFEENKHWIFRGELEDKTGDKFEEFYEEFKRLGGTDDKETYRKNLKVFFKITFNPYINRDLTKVSENEKDGYWKNTPESWNCWCGYIGDIVDAKIYFDSLDNVTAYS